jgi:1-acyl-sn-glycerol-3-phosphate acyltransferase
MRTWLQKNFHLGIPFCYGRWGLLFPKKVPMHIEIGKPMKVDQSPDKEVKPEIVDDLQTKFLTEYKNFFDRVKVKYPEYKDSELVIN